MANGESKQVTEIRKGDVVLNYNLNPVKVIGQNFTYLGTRPFLSFGCDGPLFTGEHQFLSEGKSKVVADIKNLHEEDPQSVERNDVHQMNKNTKLLYLKEGIIQPVSIGMFLMSSYNIIRF